MKNKKEKLVVIFLVVGLIVMTGVISFAAFRFTQTGSVLNQITTGSITMSYTESSNVISMTGALPTTDATGKTRLNEGEYFDFTVGASITGTANINYEIAAQELDGNTIDGSYIKYYLTKVNEDGSEEEVMAPTVYTEETSSNEYTGRPANMMSLYEGSMNASTTVKYRLRLYVDESYNPQGDGGNLIYKVRVNVYGLSGDEVEDELAPGAYYTDGTYKDWATLKAEGLVTDTSVVNYAFQRNEDIQSFVIKQGVTEIENCAFSSCSLTDISIPNSVTTIGMGAFEGYLGTQIYIPNSVTSIGSSAFQYSSIKEITIPGSIKTISSGMFMAGSLEKLIIEDGVETIENKAFFSCDMQSIAIPSSVINISFGAFDECLNLTTIYYSGTATSSPWGATNATIKSYSEAPAELLP